MVEEIQEEFMPMLNHMVFHKKLVKHILPKIQITLLVQTFKNVKTVLLQKDLNLEIKETVGLNPNIQFGK